MASDAFRFGIHLSKREAEVLSLLVEGKTDKEISSDLCLAVATVKQYVRVLRLKLIASNRTHLAVMAVKLDLLH